MWHTRGLKGGGQALRARATAPKRGRLLLRRFGYDHPGLARHMETAARRPRGRRAVRSNSRRMMVAVQQRRYGAGHSKPLTHACDNSPCRALAVFPRMVRRKAI